MEVAVEQLRLSLTGLRGASTSTLIAVSPEQTSRGGSKNTE